MDLASVVPPGISLADNGNANCCRESMRTAPGAPVLWGFGPYGGFFFGLFLIALGLLGAWLWAIIMWELHFKSHF